jgi:hypothetical protein
VTFDPTKWIAASEIVVPVGAPPTAVFLNSYTGAGVTTPWNGVIFTRGAWTTVDLSAHIPSNAKAVFLQGILIITHGSQPETADLQINLRPPSSTEAAGNYEGQTVEAAVGGGQRSPFSAWVAVEDGKFQFYWFTPTYGQWPTWSSYGVNLTVQAFSR